MNNEGNLAEEVKPGNKFPISILLHPLSRTGLRIQKICFIPKNGGVSISAIHYYSVFGTNLAALTGADLGGGCRGCAPPPPPEMTCGFLIQLVFCEKKILCGLFVLK